MCKSGSVKEDDLPVIVVFTDGNFDQMDSTLGGYCYSWEDNKNRTTWDTIHQQIVKMWVDAGYTKIPTIVYWNLNSDAA